MQDSAVQMLRNLGYDTTNDPLTFVAEEPNGVDGNCVTLSLKHDMVAKHGYGPGGGLRRLYPSHDEILACAKFIEEMRGGPR